MNNLVEYKGHLWAVQGNLLKRPGAMAYLTPSELAEITEPERDLDALTDQLVQSAVAPMIGVVTA